MQDQCQRHALPHLSIDVCVTNVTPALSGSNAFVLRSSNTERSCGSAKLGAVRQALTLCGDDIGLGASAAGGCGTLGAADATARVSAVRTGAPVWSRNRSVRSFTPDV
jgi:hypothetical protein